MKNFVLLMSYFKRYNQLTSVFKLGKELELDDCGAKSIRFCSFLSRKALSENNKFLLDDNVTENSSFVYPVFLPEKREKYTKVILLLHGLNERAWHKYLPWADYLAEKTNTPVILFPIAYHINRSPISWSNPRTLDPIMAFRRQKNGDDRSLSFANVALSERISNNPYRFYTSGRQSVSDIVSLVTTIKEGKHPFFTEGTQIDFFSYSIGSFLSQIIFMNNPKELFSDSKLFMFCGGGIFSSMCGESRSIMDKKAFDILFKYYLSDFELDKRNESLKDSIYETFCSMISPDRNTDKRLSFFTQMKERIAGISFNKDTVIPYDGVKKALGEECAQQRVKLLDFDYSYTHENPFPVNAKGGQETVSDAFSSVFSNASEFFLN